MPPLKTMMINSQAQNPKKKENIYKKVSDNFSFLLSDALIKCTSEKREKEKERKNKNKKWNNTDLGGFGTHSAKKKETKFRKKRTTKR